MPEKSDSKPGSSDAMKTRTLEPGAAPRRAANGKTGRQDGSSASMRGLIRRASGKFDFTALLTGVQTQHEPPVDLLDGPPIGIPKAAPVGFPEAPPIAIPVAPPIGIPEAPREEPSEPAVGLLAPPQAPAQPAIELIPPIERSIVPRRKVLRASSRFRINWFLVTRFGFCVWIIGMAFCLGMSGGALIEARTPYRVLAAAPAPVKAKAEPKVTTYRSRSRRARAAVRPAVTQAPAPAPAPVRSAENYRSILFSALAGLGLAGLFWAFWVPSAYSIIGRAAQTCLLTAIILVATGSGVLATMLSVEQHRKDGQAQNQPRRTPAPPARHS